MKEQQEKHGISKRRHIRVFLLIAATLLTVTAAGCFRKPSKPAGNPTTAATEPTGAETPEPTGAETPEPTQAPSSGTAFTPSDTGGRVTFTGTMAEISKAQVGDTVQFGSYKQDNDVSNGAEAIEWIVLDKQDGKLLLVSKYILDCKKYNEEEFERATWETCTLRSWLNGTFYTTAFNQTERGRIVTAKVKNEDNPEYGTEGGNDTEDKVFVLSIGEALRYFDPDPDVSDPARQAKATAYAKEDAWTWWWLRSPGGSGRHAACVHRGGCLLVSGYSVNNDDGGVRPALWLNLESKDTSPSASPTPSLTPSPSPTQAPSSDTAFTPSDTSGRVTFTGTMAEISKAQVGDTVQFGSYEQDNDVSNGAEAIEWLVLDKQDGKLLLLSKYILDCKQYNEELEPVTWETCTLRRWLNGMFYFAAFSQTEQGSIVTAKVKNEDDPEYGTEGGNDTEDKVFVLSIGEALRYFDPDPDVSDPARQTKATAYVWARAYDWAQGTREWWWLRSPGGFADYATFVRPDGSFNMLGYPVTHDNVGVRPALWLDLEP